MSWLSVAHGRLKFKHWPAECLVFNPVNGSTHLLSEFAGMVLEYMDHAGHPMTEEQLQVLFFETDTQSEDDAQALHQALHAFNSLGLIERAQPCNSAISHRPT